jgi:Ca2+-binding EF-hand superfamily protein
MLTKLKLALFIAAPLVAGATTYAVAGPGAADRDDVIQKFDKNGDGKLDDAERADKKAAFAARRAEHKQQMLAKFDKNGDGKLDDAERAQMKAAFAAERDARLAERFAAMDKNGDGQLSLDEFKAGRETGNHRHGRGWGGHHRGHGAGMKR